MTSGGEDNPAYCVFPSTNPVQYDMEYQNTLKVTLIKDNDLLYIVKGDYL